MNRLGLRGKLLVGIFLILAVSIGLVAGQAVLLFREDKANYVFELNASQAMRIAGDIQSGVRHLTEKMRIFADAVRLPVPPGADRNAILQSMLKQYPEFLLLSLREEDGKLRNLFLSRSLEAHGLSVATAHEAYLRGGIPLDRLVPDRPYLTRLGLSPKLSTFTLALREAPAAGKRGALLIAEFPITSLTDSHGESDLYEIFVTDREGKPMVTFRGGQAPGAADGKGSAPEFADLVSRAAMTAGTREWSASGVPMLAAYAPVGDLGLWTVVQIPKARAFEAARRLVERSLALAGLVGLVALTLVVFFASSLTGSLVALARATEQIGQGNYDIEIPVSGGDEIGALGARFGRMAVELAGREAALKDANLRLSESEKMTALGQLGAGIAHEVKNPLTSIRGYAQMGIRKTSPGEPMHEYFSTIEKETGRSLEILKNLLKFSRQETAEMGRLDLNSVVTETAKLVEHQLFMKKISVETRLATEPLPVIGNANQMEQVLLNLCMNAGDAMEGGGKLTLATDTQGDSARIQVADTGSGIPSEVIQKIFNPFFTTKPVGKGTGLGLSVSYGIVKEHQGEISVQSEVGKGTTFTILIPLSRGPAESETDPAPQAERRLRVINLR